MRFFETFHPKQNDEARLLVKTSTYEFPNKLPNNLRLKIFADGWAPAATHTKKIDLGS